MQQITNPYGNQTIAKCLQPSDISILEDRLLTESGQIRALSSSELAAFDHEQLQFFCLKHGVYSVPSLELLAHLETIIEDKDKALEIGAGNGVYGRELGITSTDNFMQHPKNRAKFRNCISAYEKTGQPLVSYGDNVIELDGVEAVRKYKPETVIGAWVTHKYNPTRPELSGNMFGVNFDWILDRKSVKRFILVGNINTHKNAPIMNRPHKAYNLGGNIFSRSSTPELDRVFVWDCA